MTNNHKVSMLAAGRCPRVMLAHNTPISANDYRRLIGAHPCSKVAYDRRMRIRLRLVPECTKALRLTGYDQGCAVLQHGGVSSAEV